MYDMNDADPQFSGELIPDGAYAKVKLGIRRGGIDGESEIDRGLLKASKDHSVRMLDCELTVIEGAFMRRKIWQMYTVQGGKLDDKGVSIGWKISKSAFRAMIDSALGLNPDDMSDATRAQRVLRGLADLERLPPFIVKIKIEAATDSKYSDQNRIDHVVLPNEPEWRQVMDGKDVAPKPSTRRAAKKEAPAAAAPAWGQAASAQPAANASAPAWASGVQTPAAASAVATGAAPAKTAGPSWLNN